MARFAIELPAGQEFTRTGRHAVAISRDGRRLVYVANQQLYLRALNGLAATPISGTEASNPAEPVFSPDGQWVAFWSNDELKKVPVEGGTPVMLSAVQNPLGASWIGDRILLGQATPRGIVEVPANGGAAQPLVMVDEKKGEVAHGPQLVAGGRAVLFTLRTGAVTWDDSAIVVHELATGRRTLLVSGGTDGRVLPTGHLVYFREATLFAMPFDEARLSVAGGAVPVQQGVQQAGANSGSSGAAQMAWSNEGALAFIPGSEFQTERAFVWFNRQGKEERAGMPDRAYAIGGSALRVSPDGARVAVVVLAAQTALIRSANQQRPGGGDIWVGDITRGTMTRLTFTGQAFSPIWMPDGRRVCYDNGREAFCQAADGSGPAQVMLTMSGLNGIRSISPDGTRLLLSVINAQTRGDIVMATLGPPLETRTLIQTSYVETSPTISPDGRWLAYGSDESGRSEVYVRPFPAVDEGRWQVSADGGSEPRWARNGRELFFGAGGGAAGATGGAGALQIMSVPVHAGPVFATGKAEVAFRFPNTVSSAYDVAPDGRVLAHLAAATVRGEGPQIVVVQNWFEELKARVPTTGR